MYKSFVSLLSVILIAPAAYAGDFYFGGKAGQMLTDIDGVSDPTNGAIVAGWEQGIVIGKVGVEGELTTTLIDGEILDLDYTVDTFGVYGVYRSPGPVYFKAKAGAIHEEIKIGSFSDDDTGSSIGLGIGFSLKVIKMELEYTKIEEDIDYLSLSVLF